MEGAGAADMLFDDAVRIAASTCAAPVAILSFVERNGMEVRARVGDYPARAPLEFGFCGRTIAARRIVTIPDASVDPAAASNAALGPPVFARFYAGAPLFAFDGRVLGTLAVYDHVARRLEPWQEETIERVARLVAGSLEIEASQRARERRRAAALASLAGGLAAALKGGGGSPRAAALARQLLALAGHRSLRPSSIDLNDLLARLSRRQSEGGDETAWALLLDPAIGSVMGDEERIGHAIASLARRAAADSPHPVPIATRAVQVAPDSRACGTLAPGGYVLVSIGEDLPADIEALFGVETEPRSSLLPPAGIDDVEGFMAETGGRVAIRRDAPGRPAFCLALPVAAD
jgi:GAF domain-containing protein